MNNLSLNETHCCVTGINAGRKLGVEPLLRAKDMVDSNVEHLGVMAYAAHFQWIPPRTAPSLTVAADCDTHTTRIHTPVSTSEELWCANRLVNYDE